jgi:hypothetical protein
LLEVERAEIGTQRYRVGMSRVADGQLTGEAGASQAGLRTS